MRQNKHMELAVVSVEQLHKEFEWMKEQLKKEILLDVEKLGSKELLTNGLTLIIQISEINLLQVIKS